ncbi:PKD domain-containing protein [Flammeovirga pectinis]|uniref:PKD domain-containing protein n=1 Tax=Flammeovirga pectinis TaxID=2494373 RepID=A0A3S9P3V5_9BACT|nr:PKD domain-containing protein [Flammeovirga pectinis]AZQ62762.1 PKD domain-containing protein [Flammeovirga pectinis]
MKIKLSTSLTKNIFVAVTALFTMTACTEELPGVGSIPDLTPPSADFSYKSSIANFKQVDFTNLSISAGNFTWDFADGTTSEEQDPSHVFAGEGSYDVMLKATDGNGVQSDTVITVSIVDELVPEFACNSFECSDRSVWGSFSGSGSPTPPDGDTGAKLQSATHVLDQTIKVTGGVTYNVSFHYVSASSSGTSCGQFLLEDPDNGVTFVEEGIELTPNASDYVYKSFVINTEVNTENLRFYLLPGDVTGRYDLVEIKKVD